VYRRKNPRADGIVGAGRLKATPAYTLQEGGRPGKKKKELVSTHQPVKPEKGENDAAEVLEFSSAPKKS